VSGGHYNAAPSKMATGVAHCAVNPDAVMMTKLKL
jgi:hypothetical protein